MSQSDPWSRYSALHIKVGYAGLQWTRKALTPFISTFEPFVMEATRGMSASAQRIYEKIILGSRDDARSLWPHEIIADEFRGAIAVALQTRNAMTMIAGRNLALGRAAVGCAA